MLTHAGFYKKKTQLKFYQIVIFNIIIKVEIIKFELYETNLRWPDLDPPNNQNTPKTPNNQNAPNDQKI